MGSEEHKEMLFWTKEEYQRFAEEMMDKPISYYAFQMLYWTGIREGELLALTPADFDFDRGTVKISKTYQRLKGKDVITSPKTKKPNLKKCWCIPPEHSAAFVAAMEDVLEVYSRPYDEDYPVIEETQEYEDQVTGMMKPVAVQ